ncbi:MAG: Nif3-like dinuclear metal center hexameric protein [Gemmatimonadaceae bacterium]
MTKVACGDLAAYLNQLLGVAQHPDYPQALNGLQLENRAPVACLGAAVDLSLPTIERAHLAGVNFLIVHHGMFWSGMQPLVGRLYDRLRSLIESDMAVYSVHLPLDSHSDFGNSALLARRLGLNPSAGFAKYSSVYVGVRGECDILTADFVKAVASFAAEYASAVRTTPIREEQRTRRWAICSGAGASSETLREAALEEVDTLLVGEGSHHTAVEAEELGITLIYAGHYATETLGVQALAQRAGNDHGIPWLFVSAPTGL